jgi:uncharacterized protein
LEAILEALNNVPGIDSTLVVGKDGLVITHLGEMSNEADFIGANLADIFTVLDSVLTEKFKEGLMELVTVETEKKKYFLKSINEVVFLVIIAEPRVNLGLIRLEAIAAAEKLKEVL